jgi:hypothetical protein
MAFGLFQKSPDALHHPALHRRKELFNLTPIRRTRDNHFTMGPAFGSPPIAVFGTDF